MYIGRFAPSPTGKLHAGSLVCAIASYVDARAHGGKWLIRMEDIDPPRESPGAAEDILKTLKLLGMESDEPVLYQSTRYQAYSDALESLKTKGMVFGCNCSRKSIAEACKKLGLPEDVYPGTCRDKHIKEPCAWRFKVNSEAISFKDRFYGIQSQSLSKEVGDFVLKRADGLWAYQLAVTVDDAFQQVTDIVRGADLLDNTPRQIALQKALGFTTPRYLHIPLVLNDEGQKLSKQTGAKELNLADIGSELNRAWTHLGFEPIEFSSLDDFYSKAIDSWKGSRFFPL